MGRQKLPRSLNVLHGSRTGTALQPASEQATLQARQSCDENRKLLADARRLLAEAQAELDRGGLFVDTPRGRQVNPALRIVQAQQRIVVNLLRALHFDGAVLLPPVSGRLAAYLAEGREIEARARAGLGLTKAPARSSSA